jgi:hypothetical protein
MATSYGVRLLKVCLTALILAEDGRGQTTVADTIRVGAGGGLFSGRLVISGPSMVCGGVTYAQWPLEVKVASGQFSVVLAPSAACEPQGVYGVRFIPDRGTEWVERWIVPASASPLTLAQVPRATVQMPVSYISPAQIARSGAQVGQVLTMGSGGVWAPATPAAVDGAAIGVGGDLAGSAASASVQRVRGVLYDDLAPTDGQVYVYDAQNARAIPRTINGAYADQEVPTGAVDGANLEFTLVQPPFPAASLHVWRNGILQKRGEGGDYTVSGNTISFFEVSVPQPGDLLQTSYRWAPSLPFGSQVLSVSGKAGAVALDVADIAGLTAALDAKSSTGHNHDSSYVRLDGAYVNPAWLNSIAFSKVIGISGTPDGSKFLRDDGAWAAAPGGQAAAWGAITGTLADQVDLQSALSAKAGTSHNHDSSYVRLDGAYVNPAWLNSVAFSKVTGISGTPDGSKFLRDDGAWAAAPGGQAAAWGAITGTLADQVDLQSALSAKAGTSHNHDSSYVRLDGAYVNPAWLNSIAFSKVTGIAGTPNGSMFLRDDGSWAAPIQAWGSISGSIAAQADLQSALAGKAASAHSHDASAIASGILSSARLPKLAHLVDFAGNVTKTITAAEHGLAGPAFTITCWDSTTAGKLIRVFEDTAEISSATLDVTISFSAAFTGKCLIQ